MKNRVLAFAVVLASCDSSVDTDADTVSNVAIETAVDNRPNILLIIGDDMVFLTSGYMAVKLRRPISMRWRSKVCSSQISMSAQPVF